MTSRLSTRHVDARLFKLYHLNLKTNRPSRCDLTSTHVVRHVVARLGLEKLHAAGKMNEVAMDSQCAVNMTKPTSFNVVHAHHDRQTWKDPKLMFEIPCCVSSPGAAMGSRGWKEPKSWSR